MTTTINNATKISLVVQVITGIFGLYGLTIPLAPNDIILREVLGLELIVQIIEFIFYVGFLSVYNVSDITRIRYYDWFISTPIMLFTISLYFFYVNFIEDRETKSINLFDFTKNNLSQIIAIITLNFLMLLFGFLSELGFMNKGLAFILGTGSLCGSFGIIYKNYAKFSDETRKIFWIMFGLWSMYGIAFLFPPIAKNLGYTILDIFSKNFFGLFLYYIISTKRL
jgi:bacteriorhodopsin